MSLDYRSIMNGQRKGPLPFLLRSGLLAASGIYSIAVRIRNRRYDSGAKPIHQCDAFVISVGNVTTGGTGKTPIVCYLAKWFRSQGIRVAIVSRGYGRGDADANDEAMELHERLPDVPHVQDPDRVEAARVAVEELESEVILMDDGFQHRRLKRDLDFVLVDATCPFGYGHLLPRGLLREPVSSLKRADLVFLTRCELVSDLAATEQQVREVNQDAPIVRCRHQPAALLEYPDCELPIGELSGCRVAVISAIGNPEAFEKTVSACGAQIVASRHLPDHDPFAPETVNDLRAWIGSLGSSIEQVVCTHKDLVKLRTDRMGGQPLRAVAIELSIDGDDSKLLSMLGGVVSRLAAQRSEAES